MFTASASHVAFCHRFQLCIRPPSLSSHPSRIDREFIFTCIVCVKPSNDEARRTANIQPHGNTTNKHVARDDRHAKPAVVYPASSRADACTYSFLFDHHRPHCYSIAYAATSPAESQLHTNNNTCTTTDAPRSTHHQRCNRSAQS